MQLPSPPFSRNYPELRSESAQVGRQAFSIRKGRNAQQLPHLSPAFSLLGSVEPSVKGTKSQESPGGAFPDEGFGRLGEPPEELPRSQACRARILHLPPRAQRDHEP